MELVNGNFILLRHLTGGSFGSHFDELFRDTVVVVQVLNYGSDVVNGPSFREHLLGLGGKELNEVGLGAKRSEWVGIVVLAKRNCLWLPHTLGLLFDFLLIHILSIYN